MEMDIVQFVDVLKELLEVRHEEFVSYNGRMLVSVDAFLSDPNRIVKLAKINATRVTNTQIRWKGRIGQVFNIIVQALGVYQVSPTPIRQMLMTYFPESSVTREQVSSHLQKIRERIMKRDALMYFSCVDPYDDICVRLAQKWQVLLAWTRYA